MLILIAAPRSMLVAYNDGYEHYSLHMGTSQYRLWQNVHSFPL